MPPCGGQDTFKSRIDARREANAVTSQSGNLLGTPRLHRGLHAADKAHENNGDTYIQNNQKMHIDRLVHLFKLQTRHKYWPGVNVT